MRLTVIGVLLLFGSFLVGAMGIFAPPLIFVAMLMALAGIACVLVGVFGGLGSTARKNIKRAAGDKRGTGQL